MNDYVLVWDHTPTGFRCQLWYKCL